MIEIRYSNELPIKSSNEIISAIMTHIEYKKYRVDYLSDIFAEEGVIDIGYAWTTWTDGDPILFIYNSRVEDPRCMGGRLQENNN